MIDEHSRQSLWECCEGGVMVGIGSVAMHFVSSCISLDMSSSRDLRLLERLTSAATFHQGDAEARVIKVSEP